MRRGNCYLTIRFEYHAQQGVCSYLLVHKAIHVQTSSNELNVHIIQAVGRINVETVQDVPFP